MGQDDNEAKFWLRPGRLHHNAGFRSAELRRVAELVEENEAQLWRHGMDTSVGETPRSPLAASVSVTEDELVIQLVDGRTVAVPMAWYPRLLHGTPTERAQWQLSGRGVGIHWPTLDEDISVEQVLAGVPSGESAASLRRWFEGRCGAA